MASLLGLMLVPALTGLRRSEAIYAEVRRSQAQYQTAQRAFDALSSNLSTISITLREFLLDNSPAAGRAYRERLTDARRNLEDNIASLSETLPAYELSVLDALKATVDDYLAAVQSVFEWTPEQRQQRAAYFLREEQRPSRKSILAVADNLAELNAAAYAAQEQQTNLSEQQFRGDLRQALLLTVAAGLIVSLAGILRLRSLERRASEQRQRAEETTVEMRNLSAQLRHAQEDERRSISRELHDEVGQMLTAMRMELGSLERLRGDELAFASCLTDVKDLAEQSLHLIRDIAAGLRPSVLDDLGLGAAVRRQAREFSKRTGISASVSVAGNFGRLDDRPAIYVYRIVQEALTNCAKHARAHEVRIDLAERGDAFHLMVSDDGAGFDYATGAHGGLGLIGIEERVRELGGSVSVRSRAGQGTTIDVRVPVSASRA
jgi:signal transduction histidine kinase